MLQNVKQIPKPSHQQKTLTFQQFEMLLSCHLEKRLTVIQEKFESYLEKISKTVANMEMMSKSKHWTLQKSISNLKNELLSKNEIITTLINKQNKSKSLAKIRTNLKIPTNHNYDTDFLATNDQVANALSKFRNHPSIIMIKSKRKTDQCFSFGPVTYDNIFKKIFLTLLKHLNNLMFQLRL